MNWIKYVFHWEKKKRNFEPIGNFAHIAEILTLGKASLILLPLFVQMFIMKMSTQADKQKYRIH